jgi:hypothetical protein
MSLFTVALIIVLVLVLVPIIFWTFQGIVKLLGRGR